MARPSGNDISLAGVGKKPPVGRKLQLDDVSEGEEEEVNPEEEMEEEETQEEEMDAPPYSDQAILMKEISC